MVSYKQVIGVAAVFLTLALTSCVGVGPSTKYVSHPGLPWGFVWQAPKDNVASPVSPQAAFAASARAMHFADGTEHAPTLTTWLTIDSFFAVALVQLDPDARYQDIVVLNLPTPDGSWVAAATTIRVGQGCVSGKTDFGGIVFPLPVCQVATVTQSPSARQMSRYALTSWISQDQIFILMHLSSRVPRPALGSTDVIMGPTQGWRTQQNNITTVVLPVANTVSLVFACTEDRQECQRLTTQALAHIDELAPLPATA